MNKHDAIQQGIGYLKAVETLWAGVDDIDYNHPEYPMPFEMLQLFKSEKGKAETFLYDLGIDYVPIVRKGQK